MFWWKGWTKTILELITNTYCDCMPQLLNPKSKSSLREGFKKYKYCSGRSVSVNEYFLLVMSKWRLSQCNVFCRSIFLNSKNLQETCKNLQNPATCKETCMKKHCNWHLYTWVLQINPFVCLHFETSHDSQVKVEQQHYYLDHNLLADEECSLFSPLLDRDLIPINNRDVNCNVFSCRLQGFAGFLQVFRV